MGEPSSTDPLPWTEAETLALANAILASDADRVTNWLAVHVTDPRREYAVISGIAMWAALLVPQFMPSPGVGDSWALQALGPDPSPKALGVTQMIVAALNRDHAALFAHTDALFEHDREYRADVLFQLMAAFRDFGRLAQDARAAGGEHRG